MTEGPGLDPWLANGFPPPSFVVETERVTVDASGPPLESRLLVGGALLGAVLLIFGLILLARGGGDDDETALNSAPVTTSTSSVPVVSFPPATFEGSFLVPEETVPLPTLPVAPQIPIVPLTPAPGPAPGTTQGPPTTTRPAGPTSVPTTATTTTSTSTSTTAAALPPRIERVGTSFVQPSTSGDPCSGGLVRARVTDPTLIRSVVLTVVFNGKLASQGPMMPENDQNTRSGDWTTNLSPTMKTSPPTEVRLILQATNLAGMTSTAEESFPCG